MKPTDIVAAVRAKDSKLLDGLTDKRAEQLIKAALTIVREGLAAVQTGDMQIAMLGRFKVSEVTKGEGADAAKVRRVVYVAPKPVDKEAQAVQAGKAAARTEKGEKAGKGPKAKKAE
jgi:nucleoid DNA-binding protein